MLRIHEIANAEAAKGYYRQSDYYLEVPGEWLGKGAARLGLKGTARQTDFEALCDNLRPDGTPLTARTIDGRRVGWDLNFNSSKSVGLALELTGDVGILDAHREAVAYALGHVEDDMACRVRVNGQDYDRNTGNLIAMRVTHRTTRPDGSDDLPDMSLHDHVVTFNATFDDVEGKVKAAQIGQIKHDAPYYEAIYHNRLAANLRDLGYGVRRKGKGFEIAGISDALIEKYSRRKAHIDKLAEELGIQSAKAKDKLGATTRLGKLSSKLGELAAYWDSRLTESEREQLKHLKGQPSYQGDAAEAVKFAIDHHFERQSVVEVRKLYETALRHGIGSVTLEEIQAEAQRQGVLVKGTDCTTQGVLAQEGRIIAFGRAGRGVWGKLGAGHDASLNGLSAEQQAAVRHVWESPDSVIMIRGGAGTGKTRMMTQAVAGIGVPLVVLAPSAKASRGVLREEGFAAADTVAAFLDKPEMQAAARNGVIWVDEAGLLSTRQLDQLLDAADDLGARVVLQGDKRQHAAVERSGILKVLEDYAGLPQAELTEVRRQTHKEFREAVTTIAKGDVLGGYDVLDKLGWIRQTPVFDHNQPLVDAYVKALKAKASVLVVAPTHKEGDEITEEIRKRLKSLGRLGEEERSFHTLTSLGWTTAERGDIATRREGGEIVQFVRNSGPFRAGQRVDAASLAPGQVKPEHFAVYQPGDIRLAKGDTLRITANGRDKSGKHKLNNGAIYQVGGFTKGGDIQLANGWVLDKDFGHLAHGLVVTSHASQGMTVDRVLIAMGQESRPAITAEQFYVSVSRARQQATIFTNLSPATLREAVRRGDNRQSAHAFLGTKAATPKPLPPRQRHNDRVKNFLNRMQDAYRWLRLHGRSAIAEASQARELSYER